MRLKFSFDAVELQAILSAEISNRLNRSIEALEITAWSVDDEEILEFPIIEISYVFKDPPSPDSRHLTLVHLNSSEDTPA